VSQHPLAGELPQAPSASVSTNYSGLLRAPKGWPKQKDPALRVIWGMLGAECARISRIEDATEMAKALRESLEAFAAEFMLLRGYRPERVLSNPWAEMSPEREAKGVGVPVEAIRKARQLQER